MQKLTVFRETDRQRLTVVPVQFRVGV